MNTDHAFTVFIEIKKYAEENHKKIITEQDARFQLIDRFLVEVLGWPRESFRTEPHIDEGRIDYLLLQGDRNKFVIEAKRAETPLINTKEEKLAYYKYNGPSAKPAHSALRQAEIYCMDVGVQFCAITTGYEWIGHWAIRGDGRSKNEYKIATFPTLKSIEDDFAQFYELFSSEAISKDLYKFYFNENEGTSLNQSETLYSVRSDNNSHMLKKTDMTRDIDKVFTSFFSSMSGEDDSEMLINCFVESKESKESKETDLSLQKIARNIIDGISYVDTNPRYGLEADIRDAVASERGDFALIIGNKGAGKSTYIDRFFRLTLESELRSKCLVLKVDLTLSPGNISNITNWLDQQLSKICETTLFPNSPSFDDLQGVYFREYKRWSQGEMKHLYESNKEQFKIQFGEYIKEQRLNQTDLYLANLLWHAVGARNLMPCLIFDNADHFPKDFQEAVFQYAQALYRTIKTCFVICPVTDRTIWQLSKHGPFQSYHYKAFYLPTPSTKEILQKRAAFLQSKIQLNEPSQREKYFLTKGIRISVQDMNAFVACIESIFIETDYISRLISSLCNYDIRRSLELTRKTLTSPHIAIDDLIKTYLSQANKIRIPPQKIKKAIFLGDYSQFSQEDNSFILNMYTIQSDQISSPLARLSILQTLKQKYFQTDDSDSKYFEVNLLISYLEPIGLPRKVIKRHLETLFNYRLVESYVPTDEVLLDNAKIKITPSGMIHIELGLDDLTFIEHVGIATPIRLGQQLNDMRTLLQSRKLDREDWASISGTFVNYLITQDEIFCPSANSLPGQELIRSTLRRHCQPSNNQ
ncbi:AAA family ATPase [Pseudomonas koreensis]|uniref:AAA family ATPase n=1 Tax=Pseudomonas koreensis TaxID=198620 RepID=A0A9X2XI47_9PSED|nr:AAA family ATPase [Pseudomonas koreensis]MCU7249148.1 AAA family ATPase [Pseudomonas koreensis]